MLSGFRKGEKVQEFEEEDSDSDSENEISARQVKRKRPILLKDMARDLVRKKSSAENKTKKRSLWVRNGSLELSSNIRLHSTTSCQSINVMSYKLHYSNASINLAVI